jgi:hypothetical protein
MKYTKKEAIVIANEFITEVNKLEKKYNMTFNSDTGDVYLSFKSNDDDKVWDSISLGWKGDGSGIKVIEEIKIKEKIRQSALDKLTEEERELLGLMISFYK